MNVIRAFFMCLGMFSALPCPWRPWDERARGLMTTCLPLVGAVIGGFWYALSLLGRALLPDGLTAALIAALPFLLTGFMHLDGFMDTSDAILSWRPLEQRQKILKDVHCGSVAVVAVVLLMIGMFAAAVDARSSDLRALVLIPIVSRCMSAFCVTMIKPIGHSEYAQMERNLSTPLSAAVMLLLTALIGGLWIGRRGLICIALTVLGYACAMFRSARALEGVSGDLAGHALCIGELCGLIALAVF